MPFTATFPMNSRTWSAYTLCARRLWPCETITRSLAKSWLPCLGATTKVTRQTGSHIRLTTTRGGEHHVTIPHHKSLRVGTLGAIVAEHLDIPRQTLLETLFGE